MLHFFYGRGNVVKKSFNFICRQDKANLVIVCDCSQDGTTCFPARVSQLLKFRLKEGVEGTHYFHT